MPISVLCTWFLFRPSDFFFMFLCAVLWRNEWIIIIGLYAALLPRVVVSLKRTRCSTKAPGCFALLGLSVLSKKSLRKVWERIIHSDTMIVVRWATSRPEELIWAYCLEVSLRATDDVFYILIFIKLLNSTPRKIAWSRPVGPPNVMGPRAWAQ